jgi:hypothetical protein
MPWFDSVPGQHMKSVASDNLLRFFLREGLQNPANDVGLKDFE